MSLTDQCNCRDKDLPVKPNHGECGCPEENHFAQGAVLRYYSDRKHAARAFQRFQRQEDRIGHYLYWGVHFRGQHVLNA